MLNIALCTDSFLPPVDGVGRVCLSYAQTLGAMGHACYVITPMTRMGYRGGYPFEIVDFVGASRPDLPGYRAAAALLDLHYLARVDSLKFDVVHAHSAGPAGMEAARLAAKCHVPLVGTFHPKYFDQYFPGAGADAPISALGRYVLDFYRRCDEVWTNSVQARDRLVQMGIDCNIEVFSDGTFLTPADRRVFQRLKQSLHLTDAPILLCVGSLERAKNLPRILRAAALLKARNVAFQLQFVGTGPEEHSAKALCRSLGVSAAVRFIGAIPDPDQLDALYAGAALCLFPWQSVATGLVVQEAAAQQTPSLVVRGTVSAEGITDGVNGLVCDDSAESMANAIEVFLSDGARVREIGLDARQTVSVPWTDIIERVAYRYETLTRMDKGLLRRKRGLFRKELEQVDQTLEKRALDLMGRFLRQDMQHIYVYPYQQTKLSWEPVAERRPLPRATPESQGVDTRRVQAFLDSIQSDPEAHAHAVMVVRHGKVILEAAFAPYRLDLPHQLYSLSKSVTATAVGMLVDEGKLDLDERICDIFADQAPQDASHPAHALTVRHLLTMSTGSQFNEIGTAITSDWVGEFLHAGVKFPVGTAFAYNSINTHLLAAVVCRKTGQTLDEYLTPRLYAPLGIDAHDWERAPSGIEKGGWGLSLTAESVAKLGVLYLNGGAWPVDGTMRTLIDARWIAEATRPQIETPDGEITFGYGYQVWMTSYPGAFLFNGAFGQYMLALPDRDAVVVVFSGTPRLFAQGGVMSYAEAMFADASDTPLLPDPDAVQALALTSAALTARFRAPYYDFARTALPHGEVCRRLDGLVYTFDANVASLLPVVLASMENNFGTGIEHAAFRTEADGALRVEFSEGAEMHAFRLVEEGYGAGTMTQRKDTYQIAAGYQAEQLSSEEWALHVSVHFIETPCTRLLHFLFRGDAVTLLCDEFPSVQNASEMLVELSGLTSQQIVRALLPLLKRDELQTRLKTFTTVTVQGRL